MSHSQTAETPTYAGSGDFAFQTGSWRVRHRKLRTRLKGATVWSEFDGTCQAWELMAGDANAEDNFLGDPAGPYRAAALRRFDATTGLWSIWWWDGRFPGQSAEPPMQGRFEAGVGTFYCDDELGGRPIRVRFIWTLQGPDACHWQQAFSADAGATWETNWNMQFTRA
jgi:hypothetical protein